MVPVKKFSIVIPVYKNEDNLPSTIEAIVDGRSFFPSYELEVLFVVDGSPDASYDIVESARLKYPDLIRTISLSRNFGQSAAIHCGMEAATGDVIGVISADLQDPFDLFPRMLEAWERGAKMVVGQRVSRDDPALSKLMSQTMHALVRRFVDSRYPSSGFDFFLLDRSVAERFCDMDFVNSGMQIQLVWLCPEYVVIPYERKRRSAGKSSWGFMKKVDLAMSWFACSTTAPLRAIWCLGALLLVLSAVLLSGCLWAPSQAAFMAIASLLTLVGCFVLASIAIVGEYVARQYPYLRRRPRYIVERIDGVDV